MRQILTGLMLAAAFAVSGPAANAGTPCTEPVGVNCEYCVDYLGRPHPYTACDPNNPDLHLEHCTLWAGGRCVIP